MSLLNGRSAIRSRPIHDDLAVDHGSEPAPAKNAPTAASLQQAGEIDDLVSQRDATDPSRPVSVEELLLAAADGERTASFALEIRLGGLVHANIRRVLEDALRSEAVTRTFFVELCRDAGTFDPTWDDALAWLLTRAHRLARQLQDDLERCSAARGDSPVRTDATTTHTIARPDVRR